MLISDYLQGLMFRLNEGDGSGEGEGDGKQGESEKNDPKKPDFGAIYDKGFGQGASKGRKQMSKFLSEVSETGDIDAAGATVFKENWDADLKETMTELGKGFVPKKQEKKTGKTGDNDKPSQELTDAKIIIDAMKKDIGKLTKQNTDITEKSASDMKNLTIDNAVGAVISSKSKTITSTRLATLAYKEARKFEIENGVVTPRKPDGTPTFDQSTGKAMTVEEDFADFLANDSVGQSLVAASGSMGGSSGVDSSKPNARKGATAINSIKTLDGWEDAKKKGTLDLKNLKK